MLRSIGKQSGESVEYGDRGLSLIIRRISSDADRWFVMVTPRIFSTFSRDMLSSGCWCFCYSPLGILKYDFLPVGDIQLKKVIRCSPCCNVVHFLLARAGVD